LFQTTRRVEFRDTDAAGIVHFSAFFPMMESAEHEMLRSLGISVMPAPSVTPSDIRVTWPRVSAKCDYVAAARFEDVLQIDVSVTKLGTTSVAFSFRFHRQDPERDQEIANGSIVAVCCRIDESGLNKVAIPDFHRRKLQTCLDVAPE
jgi:YbgC/YbaW family acyl-CoA thioester hydrolase